MGRSSPCFQPQEEPHTQTTSASRGTRWSAQPTRPRCPSVLATNGHGTVTRQKPLQNDFFTQHLYSAQNIRYVTWAVPRYQTVFFVLQNFTAPDFVPLAHRKQQARTKSGAGPGGVLFLGLFLFFKDVKLSTSTPTLTILLIYAAQFISFNH